PTPVSEETWVQVDAIIQRFEAAWQQDGRPSIADFLPGNCSARFRQLVLNELVAVDLERRLQLGEHRQREDYRNDFQDLPPESAADPHAIARFQREMEAIGLLDDPHIVRATDAGDASGVHYLVMELLEGIDLHRLVRLHGPLPVPDACALILQAAEGLQCAHE